MTYKITWRVKGQILCRQKMTSQHWRKPNFYIIGCPKCGTTALSNFLSQHPNIFFSPIKEPCFYLDKSQHTTSTRLCDYQALFKDVRDEHIAIGEGTPYYFYFQDTIKNLLSQNPNSKFILMIRNPIEAAASMFCQKFKHYDKRRREIYLDFNEIWNILPLRKNYEYLPKNYIKPFSFRYDELYLYGKYLKQLFRLVQRNQVHIVVYDDFKKDCLKEISQCYAFLNVDNTFKPTITIHNPRYQLKNNLFLSLLSAIQISSWSFMKNKYRNQYLYRYINKHFREPMPDIYINKLTKQKMKAFFYPDLKIAEEIVRRPLTKWLD